MPDVPNDPADILRATRERAGVLGRTVDALRADLAAATRVPNLDAAAQREGVELLSAVIAALAAVEAAIPDEPSFAAEPAIPAGPGPAAADSHGDQEDHGRR